LKRKPTPLWAAAAVIARAKSRQQGEAGLWGPWLVPRERECGWCRIGRHRAADKPWSSALHVFALPETPQRGLVVEPDQPLRQGPDSASVAKGPP